VFGSSGGFSFGLGVQVRMRDCRVICKNLQDEQC
jgi:hypothetical protein